MKNSIMLTIPENYRDRTAVSPAEAANMLGIHRTTFYRQVMPYVWSGAIQSLKIGTRRCIILESLLMWLRDH